MPINGQDMDAPVTRRELRDELAHTDRKIDEVRARLDQTNARLDQTNARLDQMNARFDEVKADATANVNSLAESFRTEFGALADKIASIPPRVVTLEAEVDGVKPRVAVLETKVFAPRKRSARRPKRR